MISITFHQSKPVPVTITMKTTYIKAKTLGQRNGVTKINIFRPTGAVIGYTTQPLLVALGQTQEYDARFVHDNHSYQFQGLHAEFHALSVTTVNN